MKQEIKTVRIFLLFHDFIELIFFIVSSFAVLSRLAKPWEYLLSE